MPAKNKGFTLVELAVVLAILAVLAAVLTPLVAGYLDQGRIARAQADTKTIVDAIKLYNRDTGRWPVYDNIIDYGYGGVLGGRSEVGTSTGAKPTAGAGWNLAASFSDTALELYINNDRTDVGSAPFPKAAFRGPYIGTVDSDPWGNKYLLNGANLRTTSTNHAYVISAGPDGILQTTRNVALSTTLAASGDDIISVIR